MSEYDELVAQLQSDRQELDRSLQGVVRLAGKQVLLPALLAWCLYVVLAALEFRLLSTVALGVGLTVAVFGFIADLVATLQRLLYHSVVQTKIALFRLRRDEA